MLKRDGLPIERSQLERWAALKTLRLLAAQVASTLMQSVLMQLVRMQSIEGREGTARKEPAELVFGRRLSD